MHTALHKRIFTYMIFLFLHWKEKRIFLVEMQQMQKHHFFILKFQKMYFASGEHKRRRKTQKTSINKMKR